MIGKYYQLLREHWPIFSVMGVLLLTIGVIGVCVLILPALRLMAMSEHDERFFKKRLDWSGFFGKMVSKL